MEFLWCFIWKIIFFYWNLLDWFSSKRTYKNDDLSYFVSSYISLLLDFYWILKWWFLSIYIRSKLVVIIKWLCFKEYIDNLLKCDLLYNNYNNFRWIWRLYVCQSYWIALYNFYLVIWDNVFCWILTKIIKYYEL